MTDINCYKFSVTTDSLSDVDGVRGPMYVYAESQDDAVAFVKSCIELDFQKEARGSVIIVEQLNRDSQGDDAGSVSFTINRNGKLLSPMLDFDIKKCEEAPDGFDIMQRPEKGSRRNDRDPVLGPIDAVHYATKWYLGRI